MALPRQTAGCVVMIEPVRFGYDPTTAADNFFMSKPDRDVNQEALAEFREVVRVLRGAGVDVITLEDTPSPPTPDSLFPNNWFSTHCGGDVILYPMKGENRRNERKHWQALQAALSTNSRCIARVLDKTASEQDGKYLEGTGSLVFDRAHKKAYCCLSQRSDESVAREVCEFLGYTLLVAHAVQPLAEGGVGPVYHTNVVMSVGGTFAVLCAESIPDENERQSFRSSLIGDGLEVIEITTSQMQSFAGNLLNLSNVNGESVIAVSSTATKSLNKEQYFSLERHGQMVVVDIPTIETTAGGGIRCMLAEVFMAPQHCPCPKPVYMLK